MSQNEPAKSFRHRQKMTKDLSFHAGGLRREVDRFVRET